MAISKIYKNNRYNNFRYLFYKDRFLLSLVISIIVHIFIAIIIFYLSDKEEKTQLRPLSLGVLNQNQQSTDKPTQKEVAINQTENIPVKTNRATKDGLIFKKDTKTPKKEKILEDKIEDINTDFDLNSMKIERDFNPFERPAPSITKNLLQKNSIDELPETVQNQIKNLYGESYESLEKDQKEYIAKSYSLNAEVFQRYADRAGYPPVAAKFNQTGQPIIEFVLFPDGHIEDVKYIRESGFYSIDESIKHIIEISAKDLLRPPKPIRIRIQGNYF